MKKRKRTTISILLALAILILTGLTGPTMTIAPPVQASMAGTGPDDASMPVADWQPLGANESHWYAFRYQGDGSQIQVRLQAEPAEGATFAIWTPDQIRRWGLGEYVEPIGRGSADPFAAGTLVWSGSFTLPGTYYVVVEQTGSQPGMLFYLLTVSGKGVAFPTSAPTPAPTADPVRPQAKPVTPSKPTGKLVFQTTPGGAFYTIHADGSGLLRITDGMDPTWSPDGRQIAFTRWRDPRGVWVVDADGSGERLVFDWSEARWPTWSPAPLGGSTGTSQILFSRKHGGQTERERCFWGRCFTIPARPHWKLGIVNPEDGTFHEPPSADIAIAPAWSPDGERIVYDGEHGLWVQSVDGEVSYQLTNDARDTSPIWSPAPLVGGTDDNHVAFVRRQHDHWEIYVVDADGRNLTRLTSTPQRPDGTPGSSTSPAWSPDGQYIAFLTDRTGKWEIWMMRADGSRQKPMFDSALEGLTLDYAFVAERNISWTQ
jgi:hypothetical protein